MSQKCITLLNHKPAIAYGTVRSFPGKRLPVPGHTALHIALEGLSRHDLHDLEHVFGVDFKYQPNQTGKVLADLMEDMPKRGESKVIAMVDEIAFQPAAAAVEPPVAPEGDKVEAPVAEAVAADASSGHQDGGPVGDAGPDGAPAATVEEAPKVEGEAAAAPAETPAVVEEAPATGKKKRG